MSGAADPVTEWRETDGPLDPGSAGEAARPGRRADAQAALPLEEPEAVPSTHLTKRYEPKTDRSHCGQTRIEV